jgi:hypothetical protein
MPMQDWIHKYPGVQALLQQDADDELLGASVEAHAGPGEAHRLTVEEVAQRIEQMQRMGYRVGSLTAAVEALPAPGLLTLHAFQKARMYREMVTGTTPKQAWINRQMAEAVDRMGQGWHCHMGWLGTEGLFFGCRLMVRDQPEPWVFIEEDVCPQPWT